MTVEELLHHFYAGAKWVKPEATADRIEVGDPNKEIRRVGTGWSACTANLEAAAAEGCDLFISHEPSFCEFWRPNEGRRHTAWGRKRAAICERAGMAQMCVHDCWDVWPVYGIRDSWMSFLGFTNPIAFRFHLPNWPTEPEPGLSLHEIPETTLDALARELIAKSKSVGAEGAVVMGDGAAKVRKVAIGVGAWIPTFEMLDLGADALVQIFDAAYQTFVRLPLTDLGANIILLEHGIIEMPGMRNMANYIARTFPAIETRFYCREPRSRFIAA